MKWLRNLSCAFTAGVVGAIALVIVATLVRGIPSNFASFKSELYRLLIWGGIWALLLVIPLFKERWFVKGSILGFIVILFNFMVLMPLSDRGFFAINAGLSVFLGNIVFNYIWGVVSAFWYKKVFSP